MRCRNRRRAPRCRGSGQSAPSCSTIVAIMDRARGGDGREIEQPARLAAQPGPDLVKASRTVGRCEQRADIVCGYHSPSCRLRCVVYLPLRTLVARLRDCNSQQWIGERWTALLAYEVEATPR